MWKLAITAGASLTLAACSPPGPAALAPGAPVCALVFGEDVEQRDAVIAGLETAGWQTLTEPSSKCTPNVFTTVVYLPINDTMGSPIAYSLTVGSWAQGVTLTPLSVNSVSAEEDAAIADAVRGTVSGLEKLRSGQDAVGIQ